jgi:hypothetical protein
VGLDASDDGVMAKKTGKPRGWRDDPAWRHQRAVKAGEAARRAHQRRAIERSVGYTKAENYIRGYRVGFNRAYQFWRAKFLRAQQQREVA